MITSSSCDYSNAKIHVIGTITFPSTTGTGAAVTITNNKVTLKHCAPFIYWILEINNTQVYDAQDILI